MMNILVTGGSGFIGRNIVKMLKEEVKVEREIGFSARVTLDKGLKLLYSSIASKE